MSYLKSLLLSFVIFIALPSWAVPVKILPLGDSITDGAGYNPPHSSYRDELYDLLTDAGYDFEFVGTRSSNYNTNNKNITLKHEGVPSIRADQIIDGTTLYGEAHAPLITKLTNYDIDIVLLLAGTNDIIQSHANDATTLADIQNIIDVLQDKNENVTVLVAKVIPVWSNPDESINLNDLLTNNWATDQSTPLSSVVIIDQHTGISSSDLHTDLVHPNQSGEDKMAQKWFETLSLQTILASQLLLDPNLTLSLKAPVPQSIIVGTKFTVNAVSESNTTVTYVSTTQDICTINNTTVTPLSAGVCTLTAEQAQNASYTADTDTLSVTVIPKTDQTITLTTSLATPKQTTKLNSTFTLSAQSSSGLTEFTYTSITPELCTVKINAVSALAAGDCKLTATQAGDANYNPANSSIKIVTIIKNEQTLTFTTPSNAKVGSDFSINANASSALTVKIISKTPKTCSIVANKAKPLTEGTCKLLAIQAGNASFNPQTKEKTIIITKPKEKSGAVTPAGLFLLLLIGLLQRKYTKTNLARIK